MFYYSLNKIANLTHWSLITVTNQTSCSLFPGWCYLTVDIEFLTGVKLPYFWIATWWLTPALFIGVSGWWLRALLRVSWGNGYTLWPLLAVFVVILVVMVMLAAVAVAKEEQFNLITVSILFNNKCYNVNLIGTIPQFLKTKVFD